MVNTGYYRKLTLSAMPQDDFSNTGLGVKTPLCPFTVSTHLLAS